MSTSVPANELALPAVSPEEVKHLNAVIRRTNKENPNLEDVQELRRLLNKYPSLWEFAGDLAAHAQQMIVSTASKTSVIQESVLQGARKMREALGESTDTALEKLLIEQCITAHLHHSLILCQYQNMRADNPSIEVALFWEKRLSASQRRFLRAVETLARVRRLAHPAMQINIGAHQTNIAAQTDL